MPETTSLVAGISCQPYSVGGAQQGGADSRAQTMPATARAAWFLQAPVLILECVVPARSNSFVRQHLRILHEQAKYCIHDEVYYLEDTWAAKRYRWWVVLSAPCLGQIPLDLLPSPASSLVVRDLMPYIKQWPQDQLDQLMLSSEEERLMQLNGRSLRSYMVDTSAKLATALHSWGNQCQSCACGCRESGLSEHLLSSRGVFAQVLPVRTSEGVKYRHLTCEEVALFCGLPPLQAWTPHARLNLCAVGQLASPLQSIWIGACIQRHVLKWLGHLDVAEPVQLLWKFKQELMQQANNLFPRDLPLPCVSQPKPCVQFVDLDGKIFVCEVVQPVCLRDFLTADGRLGSFVGDVVYFDSATGCLIDPEADLTNTKVLVRPLSALALVPQVPFDDDDFDTQMDCSLPASSQPTSLDLAMLASCEEHDSSPMTDPLSSFLDLKSSQLVQLLPPLVTDQTHLEVMFNQFAPSASRLSLLSTQELVWADDEIRFGLGRILESAAYPGVCMLDPLLAHGWFQAGMGILPKMKEWFEAFNYPVFVVSVVHWEGHWTPVIWKFRKDGLDVHLWDHANFDTTVLWPLHQKMCVASGTKGFSVFCTQRSFGLHHCGAAALAFLTHKVVGTGLPISEAELQSLHDDARHVFAAQVSDRLQVPRPWCFGSGPGELGSTLEALLQFHGVPPGQAASRSRLILQSLGREEVSKAIHGIAPWKSLKALANLHKPPLQLVMPDELAAKAGVESNPKAKKPKKSGKPPVVGPAKPADLDPSKLTIDEGVFRVANDVPVKHLSLSQVGPLAKGVALTSYQEALPFLKSGSLLTSQGLALIILDGPDEPDTRLTWSTVRFAARCTLNLEPMLLTGCLLQLGQQPVFLHSPQNAAPVPSVPVTCARLVIFRDQWEGDWTLFTTKPVKQVFELISPLQTCRTSGCTCAKWHVDSQYDCQEVVLDVFRRQYLTEAGRPTSGDKAAQFAFMIRYVKTQEPSVLPFSGKGGVFIEPKTEDATKPSDDYQVVWLPTSDFSDAQHKAQCETHAIGLARHGQRYGIRVAAPYFQAVFKTLKPDAMFLSPGPRTLWTCGPWPFGVDRKGLGRILKQWQWDARPLQPSQTVQGGLMWSIQAVTDPPNTVYSLPHGQVVISKQTAPSMVLTPPREVIGPSTTVQLCAHTGNATASDPWLEHDPWKKYDKARTVPVSSEAPALKELEKRLEESLLNKIPQQPQDMDVEGTETRMTQLEQQVQTLMQQHRDLEVKVADNHAAATAQVHSLQGHMQTQFEAQGRQMQTMMEDQMSRIEAILARKPHRAAPYGE